MTVHPQWYGGGGEIIIIIVVVIIISFFIINNNNNISTSTVVPHRSSTQGTVAAAYPTPKKVAKGWFWGSQVSLPPHSFYFPS